MGIQENDAKMEGWLYTIRSNRFGLQFSRKRYYVLEQNCLKCYKTIPTSDDEELTRSATIDSCIKVTDNGRENINRKVFYIFTLYSTLNHNDQLKLGASSSEEAARWISTLKDALLKVSPSYGFLRLSISRRTESKRSIDYYSTLHTEAMTSDVIAPSPWKIFGCQNGLRLFREAKDAYSKDGWDDNPAIMGVGVVNATSEAIFRTVMSLGQTRAEWDFCFYRGSVVEHLDGHTDIIHKQLYSEWLPWGMRRRDLLLRRYWRREDDGTYVILYHSVIHKKCPPQKGYVRACLKSGGYVITPINDGNRTLVKHMLAADWKFWKIYLRPASAKSVTIRMVERVAALREMFKAKAGNYSISRELARPRKVTPIETHEAIDEAKPLDKIKPDVISTNKELGKKGPLYSSLVALNDSSDEFFDVPDQELIEFDQTEVDWSSSGTPTECAPDIMQQPAFSSAAGLVKKLHDLAVHKKGYADLQDTSEENSFCSYGSTLQKDPNGSHTCSWSSADPSTFLIRGETYLKDSHKVKARGTLMQLVGADWLKSDQWEQDLGSRPDGIVQKYALQNRPEFFFIVNIQVPGVPVYTLALYYMLKTPLEEHPLLNSFVNGDDAYRNSRFKLIPFIPKGSWIVKQSVGKKSCLVGQALEIHYFRGKNYLELAIDVGSSTVARGVVSLVNGYMTNLVVEMAFLIQANTEEELPELLLGTCRLNNLDVGKAVAV
ncbi:Protein ENHANCED DISEASE RESISTANCE 2-like [Linum perenne]